MKIRKWIHMFIRRLEQFNPTEENVDELRKTSEAVAYIHLLKKAECEQRKNAPPDGPS